MFSSARQELARFFRAALLVPIERDHRESNAAVLRRRIVVMVTLIVGVIAHGFTLRLAPGDDRFFVGTAVLALVWGGGALLSGPLHLGEGHTRKGGRARPWLQGLLLGLLLLAIFLVGALIVLRVPFLRDPVDQLLAHASYGPLALVALVTAANGIVEELFYRGALFAAIGRTHAVLISTIVYAAVTSAAGIPLLTFAALCLGLVTGLQRRVTGGVLAPIVTHLVWSLGMLVLLPRVLQQV